MWKEFSSSMSTWTHKKVLQLCFTPRFPFHHRQHQFYCYLISDTEWTKGKNSPKLLIYDEIKSKIVSGRWKDKRKQIESNLRADFYRFLSWCLQDAENLPWKNKKCGHVAENNFGVRWSCSLQALKGSKNKSLQISGFVMKTKPKRRDRVSVSIKSIRITLLKLIPANWPWIYANIWNVRSFLLKSSANEL